MRNPDFQNLSEEIFNIQISKSILIDECTSVGAALYGYYNKNKTLSNFEYFKEFIEKNYYNIGCECKFNNEEGEFKFFKDKNLNNEFDIVNIVPYNNHF